MAAQTPQTPAPSAATPVSFPASQALLLHGKSFPPVARFVASLPAPRRTFYVKPGQDNGDGSEANPWNDLQSSLCALQPGDRLRVRPGDYAGPIRVDTPCGDGTARRPIQVLFDGKAKIKPDLNAAALTLRRAHWHFVGLTLELGESAAPGVSIEGAGAHHIVLDGARIAEGGQSGVRIGEGASHVTVANSRIAKPRLREGGPDAAGIVIAASAAHVLLTNNRLHQNPGGSIRVEAPAAGGRPAQDVEVRANTLRGNGPAAVSVAAADGLRITGNTISDVPGLEGTRGIALEEVRRTVVRSNHISHCAVGIQIGHADPDGPSFRGATDVSIERNYLESALPAGFAIDVEAGARVRIAHNTIQGFANGLLVFGGPPRTLEVTVVNNLVLGVTEFAFVLTDPAAAALFDYNLFSTGGGPANVEMGTKTYSLAGYLKTGAMPHTRIAPAAKIQLRDLARVTGAKTVDQGKALEGVDFRGAAPDLGVAEQ